MRLIDLANPDARPGGANSLLLLSRPAPESEFVFSGLLNIDSPIAVGCGPLANMAMVPRDGAIVGMPVVAGEIGGIFRGISKGEMDGFTEDSRETGPPSVVGRVEGSDNRGVHRGDVFGLAGVGGDVVELLVVDEPPALCHHGVVAPLFNLFYAL